MNLKPYDYDRTSYKQKPLMTRKFFRPRDIGCNRYPIYDETGKYLRDGVKSGFEFYDFDNLKQKLVELLGLKLYDHLYITEDGGVINGLCIGYVEPPEELSQGHSTDPVSAL